MVKRIISIGLILALIISVTPSKAVESSGADTVSEYDGVWFYYDDSFTERILPSIDLSGEYEAQYAARINIDKSGSKKVYLRLKDDDTYKYRLTDKLPVVMLRGDGFVIEDEEQDKLVSIRELSTSKEGDRKFEVTLKGSRSYGSLRLYSYYQELYNGDTNWSDFAYDSEIMVDYIDRGLNISDRNNVEYNRYLDNGTSWGGYILNLPKLDYGSEYAYGVPGFESYVSFSYFDGTELDIIKDPTKLKVYKADGRTETNDVTIEDYFPVGADENDGAMILYVMPDVELGSSYIIKYSDGKNTSQLSFVAQLPPVGIYTEPVRSVANYVNELEYTDGRSLTYYVLSDKNYFRTGCLEYYYGDNGYNTSYDKTILDEKDGVYGYKINYNFTDCDGPIKINEILNYTNTSKGAVGSGFAFFYATVVRKGDTKVYNDDIYKVTKAAGSSSLGKVSLISADKTKKKDTIPYTVTIAGVPFEVVKIGASAYKNAKKLKKITIGTAVTSIGKAAFSGCKKLSSITIESEKLKTVTKGAFKNIPKTCIIKVPKAKKTKYKKLLKKAGFKGKIK